MRAFSRLALLSLLGASLALPSAQAFVTVGHGRIIGVASVRADYDSNIFANSTQISDTTATGDGSVRYLRDEGLVTFEAAAGVSVVKFRQHTDQDSTDPYLEGRLGYVPSDKTEFHGDLSLRRNTAANEQVGAVGTVPLATRTKSNDFLVNGQFQQLTSEKLGFRINSTYGKSNYLTAGFSDIEHYGLGLSGVHLYSPKLKILAGITELEWWTSHHPVGRVSPSSRDWRYTVGAEGELASKITGEVSVGYVKRAISTAGFRDADALYLASRLVWATAEKTTLSLLAGQDLSVSAADQSVRAFNTSLLLNQVITEKVGFEGSFGYDRASFTGARGLNNRDDHGYNIRGRVGIALKENVSLDVSTGYRKNYSTLAVSRYDRFSVGAGVSVRF